jgi:RimJ/RimL family protein N-acetyltransferase
VRYIEVDVPALFALELSLSADEPGEDEPRQLTFEEWREDLFDGPDVTHEGSYAVVSAGEPVTYAAHSVDPGTCRGRIEGTATAAAHRGLGLATLAKLAQLRWAAANWIDQVVTDNDERNAPMLAINLRLGYEPFTERRGYLKER